MRIDARAAMAMAAPRTNTPVPAAPAAAADRYQPARPAPKAAAGPALKLPKLPLFGSLAAGGLLGAFLGPFGILGGMLVGGLVGGNLAILAAHKHLARNAPPAPIPAAIEGPHNQTVVDDRVWRGSAPHGLAAYRSLARAGVTTVVDLRAERGLTIPDDAALAKLGIKRVSIAIRDGQIPTDAQVRAFRAAVEASRGQVYLHCGAGVGRTGSMAAAYLVATGQASADEALRRNMAVGPPSLEQITYMRGLRGDDRPQPGPLLTGLSRVLDAPRRLWSRVKHLV